MICIKSKMVWEGQILKKVSVFARIWIHILYCKQQEVNNSSLEGHISEELCVCYRRHQTWWLQALFKLVFFFFPLHPSLFDLLPSPFFLRSPRSAVLPLLHSVCLTIPPPPHQPPFLTYTSLSLFFCHSLYSPSFLTSAALMTLSITFYILKVRKKLASRLN